MKAVNLSEPTANAVADNGIAHLIGNGKSDAVSASIVSAAIARETRHSGAVSFGIDAPKFVILF